jgi:hypothetical protein
MMDLEHLAAEIAGLRTEVRVLTELLREVLGQILPCEFLRTGAMSRVARISKSTLYAWERRSLITRHHDSLGQVCWEREEVVRVLAAVPEERRGRLHLARNPDDV